MAREWGKFGFVKTAHATLVLHISCLGRLRLATRYIHAQSPLVMPANW